MSQNQEPESPIIHFHKSIRLRACGILIENDEILLVKHSGLGKAGFLWNPPGGGLQFGESVSQAVEREFLEETGLVVQAGEFVCFSEHIGDGLHALELFFRVNRIGGTLALGTDPELAHTAQLMVDLRFWPRSEIENLPGFHFHRALKRFF